jgi:hypothetical protein
MLETEIDKFSVPERAAPPQNQYCRISGRIRHSTYLNRDERQQDRGKSGAPLVELLLRVDEEIEVIGRTEWLNWIDLQTLRMRRE